MIERRNMSLKLAGCLSLFAVSFVILVSATPACAENLTITPGSFKTELSTNQAGAHPDLTTTFAVEADAEAVPLGGTVRDLSVKLPPGLVGAANATPTCPMNLAAHEPSKPQCPLSSAVGEVLALVTIPGQTSTITWHTLLFNVTPSLDEPAAFGFYAEFPVRLDTSVRSDGDYGITASSTNLTEGGSVLGATVMLWGVPADHNGPGSKLAIPGAGFVYGGPGSGERRAFLTNPTECTGASLSSSLSLDSCSLPVSSPPLVTNSALSPAVIALASHRRSTCVPTPARQLPPSALPSTSRFPRIPIRTAWRRRT